MVFYPISLTGKFHPIAVKVETSFVIPVKAGTSNNTRKFSIAIGFILLK
jgi:hypothetical protein